LNNLLTNSEIEYCEKFKIYKQILSTIKYYKDYINNNNNTCFNVVDQSDSKIAGLKNCPTKDPKPIINSFEFTKVEPVNQQNIYLKQINPQEIEDLSKEEQQKLIELNDIKFSNISVNFLQNLKGIGNPDKNLSILTPEEKDEIIELTKASEVVQKPIPLQMKVKEITAIPKRETDVQSYPSESVTESEEIEFGGAGDSQLKTSDITPEQLDNFYKNTYKCNIGNYLKSFKTIINDINQKYYNLLLKFNIDDGKTLVIKILLLYIKLVNDSFIPNINSNDIINTIEKVDNSYSTEKMNTILNTYSIQLDTYMVIYGLINTDEITNIDLINIFNSSISYNIYRSLDIPFSMLMLKNKIMNKEKYTELNMEEEEVEEEIPPIQETKTTTTNKSIDYTKLYPKQYVNDYNRVDQNIYNAIPVGVGGISIKHKKNKKFFKTRKNKNKNKNKKSTIKKNNKRKKNNTRKI
jgi:hypothetical protein